MPSLSARERTPVTGLPVSHSLLKMSVIRCYPLLAKERRMPPVNNVSWHYSMCNEAFEGIYLYWPGHAFRGQFIRSTTSCYQKRVLRLHCLGHDKNEGSLNNGLWCQTPATCASGCCGNTTAAAAEFPITGTTAVTVTESSFASRPCWSDVNVVNDDERHVSGNERHCSQSMEIAERLAIEKLFHGNDQSGGTSGSDLLVENGDSGGLSFYSLRSMNRS